MMDFSKYYPINTSAKIKSIIEDLRSEMAFMQYGEYRTNTKQVILNHCFDKQLQEEFCNRFEEEFYISPDDLRDSKTKLKIRIIQKAEYDIDLLRYDFAQCCACAGLAYKKVETAFYNYALRNCRVSDKLQLMHLYAKSYFRRQDITVSTHLFNRLCQFGSDFAVDVCIRAIHYSSPKKKKWKDFNESAGTRLIYKWQRPLAPTNDQLRKLGERGPRIIYTPFGGQNGKKHH